MKVPEKKMSPFLSLFILISVFIVTNSTKDIGDKYKFECENGSLRTIDLAHNSAGVLQTVDFPERLRLPLKCAWILDNSRRRSSKKFAHFYFTRVSFVPITRSLSLFLLRQPGGGKKVMNI